MAWLSECAISLGLRRGDRSRLFFFLLPSLRQNGHALMGPSSRLYRDRSCRCDTPLGWRARAKHTIQLVKKVGRIVENKPENKKNTTSEKSGKTFTERFCAIRSINLKIDPTKAVTRDAVLGPGRLPKIKKKTKQTKCSTKSLSSISSSTCGAPFVVWVCAEMAVAS